MEKFELYTTAPQEPTTKSATKFWKIVYANIVWMLIIILLCASLGVGLAFIKGKPYYTAECDIILKLAVDSKGYSDEQTMSNNTTLAKNYLPTIKDVILSPKTVKQASSYNGYEISASQIGVSFGSDSLIFTLSYTDADIETAKLKLEDVIRASQDKLTEEKPIVATEIKLVKTQGDLGVSSGDNKSTFILLGLVAGVAIAFAFVVIKFLLNNKVTDADELEELTGKAVLSYIKDRK
jgi:capsular polysaccharide biosynthesis protein